LSLPREITKKLQGADPELSRFVKELEKENLRLHKKIAKLQVENVTKDNEIKALNKFQPPEIQIVFPRSDSPAQPVTPNPAVLGTPMAAHPAPPAPGEPLQITK
jgi:hypothetical protein